MSKYHSYSTRIPPTQDQLLLATVDGWTQYAENKMKQSARSSNLVKWKCFNCSKEIRVGYKCRNPRYLYCKECRPKIVKRNGVLIRYLMMFRNHVRAIILTNTAVKDILS